jgi:hypothetical protein
LSKSELAVLVSTKAAMNIEWAQNSREGISSVLGRLARDADTVPHLGSL